MSEWLVALGHLAVPSSTAAWLDFAKSTAELIYGILLLLVVGPFLFAFGLVSLAGLI